MAVFVSDVAFVLLKWNYNQTMLNINPSVIIRHVKAHIEQQEEERVIWKPQKGQALSSIKRKEMLLKARSFQPTWSFLKMSAL